MNRKTASLLLTLFGVALACLATLDAFDYEVFWISFGWR